MIQDGDRDAGDREAISPAHQPAQHRRTRECDGARRDTGLNRIRAGIQKCRRGGDCGRHRSIHGWRDRRGIRGERAAGRRDDLHRLGPHQVAEHAGDRCGALGGALGQPPAGHRRHVGIRGPPPREARDIQSRLIGESGDRPDLLALADGQRDEARRDREGGDRHDGEGGRTLRGAARGHYVIDQQYGRSPSNLAGCPESTADIFTAGAGRLLSLHRRMPNAAQPPRPTRQTQRRGNSTR